MRTVVVVEDQPVLASAYGNKFRGEGFNVEVALDGEQGPGQRRAIAVQATSSIGFRQAHHHLFDCRLVLRAAGGTKSRGDRVFSEAGGSVQRGTDRFPTY